MVTNALPPTLASNPGITICKAVPLPILAILQVPSTAVKCIHKYT